MKSNLKLILVAIFLFSGQAHATIVTLSSDQSSYTVEQRAALTALIAYPLANDSDELYFEATLNGTTIPITKTSDLKALTVSPIFTSSGSEDWEVDVYVQNKIQAKGLEDTIQFYSEKEIPRLQCLLLTETDATQIANTQAEIATDQNILAGAQDALENARGLLEVDQLTFSVNASGINLK